MENGGGHGKSKGPEDFYHVLGVHKECTASDLRTAYKKLALRWHPDRCSASGNSKFVEEAKNKFQTIQQAYSVLSDDNKRFLYDVGVYDSDDDDENGMADFLDEMAVMMSQTKHSGHGEESFEQLQELFVEMFQGDIGSIGSSRGGTSCSSTSSSHYSFCDSSNSNNLQTATSFESSTFDSHFQKFCPGVAHHQKFKKGEGARRREQGTAGRRRGCGINEEIASSWL